MAKYRVICDITVVSGFQAFLVDADSPTDAVERCKRGECEFEFEEVDIQGLDYPSPSDVHEVDETKS